MSSPPAARPLAPGVRSVLLEVMRHGPLARAQLARRLDLSPASLTRMTAPLIDAGLLSETGESVISGSGRPSRPIDVVPDARHFIGVRLTQDTASAVLTDLHAQVSRSAERSFADPRPGKVTDLVAELVSEVRGGVGGVTALGICLGGDIRDHRVVVHAPFLEWDEVPLADLLEGPTGLPVVVDNDLLALTKAEHWFGTGRETDRFAVLTIGVGTGYGLVMHDEVVESADAGVGLLGHFPLDANGARCGLGHRGCAAAAITFDAVTSPASLALGRPVGYEEALDLAAEGDSGVTQVVTDAGRALGRLVVSVANIAMTGRVVLAGEGARLASVVPDAVEASIREGRDPRASELQLEVREPGFESWACGAAVAAMREWVEWPGIV